MKDGDIRIETIALEHARAVCLFDSELRSKNFNFFLVIIGVLVAAYLKNADLESPLATVGILASVLFWILDVRVTRFLVTADEAVRSAEDALGISVSPFRREEAQQKRQLKHFFRKGISHTFAYRSVFLITGVSSITVLILRGFSGA